MHVLVDLENVQPSLEELAKLAPGFTDVWLFHGPNEAKKARGFAASHERVTLVPRSGQGPNALDFHLSFYLGYVAAKHPDAELVVVANDGGYDPMLAHARMLKFSTRRLGYEAPGAKRVAVVKPPAPVAVKKAVTKTSVAKEAVAKKAATLKPAKAAQPAKPPTPTSVPQATPETKTLARIQQGLIRMGSKAPQKVKPFRRHVGALLGKGSTAEQIAAIVAKLEATGAVWFIGDEVVYNRK